ncbi:hypothetical protein N9W34_01115 [Rickettsiales bacterium]|nr:hypothetical protein [Rickettsiales bacterium]
MSQSHLQQEGSDEEQSLTTEDHIKTAIENCNWDKLQEYLPDNLYMKFEENPEGHSILSYMTLNLTDGLTERFNEEGENIPAKPAGEYIQLIKTFWEEYKEQLLESNSFGKIENSGDDFYQIFFNQEIDSKNSESINHNFKQVFEILIPDFCIYHAKKYEETKNPDHIRKISDIIDNIINCNYPDLSTESLNLIRESVIEASSEDFFNEVMSEIAPNILFTLFESCNPETRLDKIQWIKENIEKLDSLTEVPLNQENKGIFEYAIFVADFLEPEGFSENRKAVFEAILDLGIDINRQNSGGETILDQLIYNFARSEESKLNQSNYKIGNEFRYEVDIRAINFFISKGATGSNPQTQHVVENFFGQEGEGLGDLINQNLEENYSQLSEEEEIIASQNFIRTFNNFIDSYISQHQAYETQSEQPLIVRKHYESIISKVLQYLNTIPETSKFKAPYSKFEAPYSLSAEEILQMEQSEMTSANAKAGLATMIELQQTANARRSARTDESEYEKGEAGEAEETVENLPKRRKTGTNPEDYKRTGNGGDSMSEGRQR